MVRMRRLELPYREAPDPKSILKHFQQVSFLFKTFQNIDKIGIIAKKYFSFIFFIFLYFSYFVVKTVVKNIKYMERNY